MGLLRVINLLSLYIHYWRSNMNVKNCETWELKNMIKALSMFELLNTEEANKRLQEAKKELRNRRRK